MRLRKARGFLVVVWTVFFLAFGSAFYWSWIIGPTVYLWNDICPIRHCPQVVHRISLIGGDVLVALCAIVLWIIGMSVIRNHT